MKKKNRLIATCIIIKIKLILALCIFALPTQAQITINTETSLNEEMQTHEVHFIAHDFEDILALQLSIRWNANTWNLASFSVEGPLGLRSDDVAMIFPGENNKFVVSWIDDDVQGLSLPNGSRLFTLGFQQIEEGGLDLVFANSPLAIEVINTDLENIGLTSFTNEVVDTQVIRGRVMQMVDNDCNSEEGLPLASWSVELGTGESTRRIQTDNNGGFVFAVDANTTYTLTATPPFGLWEICEPIQTITVPATAEANSPFVDFKAKVRQECAVLEVDVSTPFLRRCFPNTYTVNYANIGTVTAEAAHIIIDLDETFDFQSSSIPATDLGNNQLQFDLGDIPASNFGRFAFEVVVNCEEATLGQTHCVEANIFPKPDCFDNSPNWSGAELELAAGCKEDATLEFKIRNVGEGDMLDEQAFSIVEDMIMLHQSGSEGVFKLRSGEEFLYEIPATGATYRLETEQVPNHPFHGTLALALEGCGEDDLGEFSTGFVTMLPLAGKTFSYDIDCQENRGAYDPNDKQGFPKGVGSEHWLKQNTDIEYLIRFQNTGTDTAFNIVVLDTLSPLLEPESVKPLVASHDYTFEQLDKNILKFTFANIMLPDSNINEVASHGFIRFKVSQQPDLEDNLLIENQAAIYFDFNEPIFTNTTVHKTGEEPLTPVEAFELASTISASPNPFDHQAIIEMEEQAPPNTTFVLYDLLGREMRRMPFEGNRLLFQRGSLVDGIYFYEVQVDGKIIHSDKLSIQSID